MNAVFTMILRNLRTELEHTDQRMVSKDAYIQKLEKQIHELSQQKNIDELTGTKPLFTKCACGWTPEPGAIIKVDDKQYICPRCQTKHPLGETVEVKV